MGYNSANAAAATTGANPTVSNNSNRIVPAGMGYCFTHGLTYNEAHTSETCNHPCPEHDRTATMFNMKGGNNMIKRLPNEGIVYRPRRRSNGNGNAPTENTETPADNSN